MRTDWSEAMGYNLAAKGSAMKKSVAYYRVSTVRQGKSGLGLEAQKQLVKDFAKANHYQVTKELVEIESGKRNSRPVLLDALQECKKENATLLIAKLDRLGRNVAFISKLMEAGVDFKAVDNPYAGKLVVHIMAAFAEHERDQISERTIAALKIAKQKGVELGYNGKYILSKENKEVAGAFAQAMKPLIDNLKEMGVNTVRKIADELNRLHIPTFRNMDNKWHPSTVHRLIHRMNESKKTILN